MRRRLTALLVSLSVSLICSMPLESLGQTPGQSSGFAAPDRAAEAATISAIRSSITNSGARWEAGETSVSALPPDERRSMLGLNPRLTFSGGGASGGVPPVEMSSVTLPSALDWRSFGGGYVTDVRNQRSCGSCWAFGSTAGLESSILIRNGTPGTELDLSEQVLVSCDSGDWGSPSGGCEGGALVDDYLVNTGLPLESCFSYDAVDESCGLACANWQAAAYKTPNYTWFSRYSSPTKSAASLKAALFNYGPIVVSFQVYGDFYYYRSGIYSYTSGGLVGGHAVLVVGYDDANSCFIVKNSWGKGWGEDGFFRIAYSEVTNTAYTYFAREQLGYGPPVAHTFVTTFPADGETVTAGYYDSPTAPAFTWNGLGYSKFSIMFSTTDTFAKTVRYSSDNKGMDMAFHPNQKTWAKLTALGRRLYWKVQGADISKQAITTAAASLYIGDGFASITPVAATPVGSTPSMGSVPRPDTSAVGLQFSSDDAFTKPVGYPAKPGPVTGSPVTLTPDKTKWAAITKLGPELFWRFTGKLVSGETVFSPSYDIAITGGPAITSPSAGATEAGPFTITWNTSGFTICALQASATAAFTAKPLPLGSSKTGSLTLSSSTWGKLAALGNPVYIRAVGTTLDKYTAYGAPVSINAGP